MSFRDCIQSAVETGRVTERKGAIALAEYDAKLGERIAAGDSPIAADLAGAAAAVEHTTSLTSANRWKRINEMQRAHEIHTRLQGAKEPWRELEKIMEEVEYTHASVRGTAMAGLDAFMEKFSPKKGGLVNPVEDLRDVVRGAYGDAVSPEARAMADAVIGTREMLRKWANMYGTSIPENANARLPQTHDMFKVSRVTEEEWVNDHLRTLDWNTMKFHGKLVPEADRAEILGRTYRGIVNDGFDRGDVAQLHKPGLASRLNRDRFLYYKDADAYIAMAEKYGRGNLYEQTIGMVEAMSKDIATLKVFGPSADSMKEFTKRSGEARAAELNNARPAGKKTVVKKMERAVSVFDDMYKIHSWHSVSGDGNWAVATFSTIRTLATNAMLGSSLWANMFGDLANAQVMKHVLNMPEIKVLSSYLDNWTSGAEGRMDAARAGVIAENYISQALGVIRYLGALEGPHIARRISDVTYRLTLASYHTQMIRNALGKEVQGVFAKYRKVPFDQLPFASNMTERGITPEDWDAFRATGLYTYNGATFLRPMDMFQAGDDAAKKVATKFSNMMQEYIRAMVPDTSLRSQRALGGAADQNSVMAQAWRGLTALMSFPLAIHYNQLQRIAHIPGIRNKLKFGAVYAVAMMMAGALITQTKAIISGQNPHDMRLTDDNGHLNDFWFRSFVNGGTMGLFGDLIFDNVNFANSRLFKAGPVEKYISSGLALTVGNLLDASGNALKGAGLLEGEQKDLKLGSDFAKFVSANIPDLWWAKLAIDRAFGDALEQKMDPAGWDRKQQWVQENVPHGRWWEPGQSPEAPNLATAVGD